MASVGGLRWGPKMEGDEVYGWEAMEVRRWEMMYHMGGERGIEMEVMVVPCGN